MIIFRSFIVLLIQLALLLILCENANAKDNVLFNKVKAEIKSWRIALDMYFVDWSSYPKENSIEEIAEILKALGYWQQPVTKDPGTIYISMMEVPLKA